MKATDKKDNDIRELYFSDEFAEFYGMLQDKVKAKFEHTMDIIRTEYVLSTKFVKHLENTDLYEMRVSVNTNEYRTILFAVDNKNIILSKKILLLNGFLKKSTKDYLIYIVTLTACISMFYAFLSIPAIIMIRI